MITLLIYFAGALLILALLALLTPLLRSWIRLLDEARGVAARGGLDFVQFYSGLSQARLDVETRESKLEYGQELARLRLLEQRRKLLGEVER